MLALLHQKEYKETHSRYGRESLTLLRSLIVVCVRARVCVYICIFVRVYGVVQVTDYMKTSIVSQVVIDRTEDADFRVNFNVTLPEISCDHLSVDIMDALGHRRSNLSEHGCEGNGKTGGWCYVINKYVTVEGQSLKLAGSQYARQDTKNVGQSIVGGYKRSIMNDFEGVVELDPKDAASYTKVKQDLDVEAIVQLIDSIQSKQGVAPTKGSQAELMEKEKLLKSAQNLHIWLTAEDPVRELCSHTHFMASMISDEDMNS